MINFTLMMKTMKNKKNFFIHSFFTWMWMWIGIGCLAICVSIPLAAQKDLPFDIKAERQEMTEDLTITYGNVEISWEEYRIYADYLEYNHKTREINAKGRITMSSNQTVLTGEALTFNIEKRTGVMYDVYGQSPPSVRYKTQKLTQVNNETLKFDKIDFTSCSQCKPRWKITCRKGTIKKEKYVEMKGAVFKIKNIPVFYLPYLRYPLEKEGRATGFLFPVLGSSNRRGFFLINSFFWAIKPNVDLTLSFDYYKKAGIGGAGELRYLFRHMSGEAKFYMIKYNSDVILPEGQQPPSNNDAFFAHNKSDYFLKFKHNQSIPALNTRIIASVDKQSDASFLRLFSNDFDSVMSRTSKSSISLSTSFSNIRFGALVSQNDTFYTFNNKSNSMRYFPQLTFNVNQQRFWKFPGYFSLDTIYSSAQRKGISYDADNPLFDQDVKSQRLNIIPSYTVSLIRFPYLSTSLSLKSKYYYSPKSYDPNNLKDKIIIDEPIDTLSHSAQVDLKGPILSKIYQSPNGKLKHLITPSIAIRYVTQVNPNDLTRIIKLDYSDYPDFSSVKFSLNTRLLAKNKTEKNAREVFSYTVSQNYFFDPKNANQDRKVNGEYPEFSELTNELRVRPLKNFVLDVNVNFNHYIAVTSFIQRFTRVSGTLSYTSTNRYFSANASFNRYVNQYSLTGDFNQVFNRDSMSASLNVDFPSFPIKLDSRINYDLTDREFRYGTFQASFDYQCVNINAQLVLFKYTDRVEKQFLVGFSLSNLGMVKDFLGIDKNK